MNDGFLKLSEDRQQEIVNAGFKVFAQNPYKKAPAAEIASEAGISKALLFYHFKNKKELYLYLWEKALSLITNELSRQQVFDTKDYFEMLSRSLRAKCNVMRKYPYMMEFSLRAYYEKAPEVVNDIRGSFDQVNQESQLKALDKMDRRGFLDGIDFSLMYQEMVWSADGYMRNALMMEEIDPDKIEHDFDRLISQWKKVYLKREV